MNLCSKCFKELRDRQKEDQQNPPESTLDAVRRVHEVKVVPSPMSAVESPVEADDTPDVKIPKKNRCNSCRKKLRLAQRFTCRCELVFCVEHRFADDHDCQFDYKQHTQDILKKANPAIVSEKIAKI